MHLHGGGLGRAVVRIASGSGTGSTLVQTQVKPCISWRNLSLNSNRLQSSAQDISLEDDPWVSMARQAAEGSSVETPVSERNNSLHGHLKSHIFKHLSPWKSKEELAKHLQASILYNTDGLIAINKPMGVGVLDTVAREEDRVSFLENQGKESTKHDSSTRLYHTRGLTCSHYTLEDVLPILRKELGLPELEIVKSAEKYNSGVAILSANEKIRMKIKDSIRKAKHLSQHLSTFSIISLNIPLILERSNTISERVGIGIIENEEIGMRCPIIQRNFSKKAVRNDIVSPINVELQVLSRNKGLNVCHTQIKVSGTKSNFLRVYYADLATPILGDHLYSARVKSVGGFMTALNPLSVRVGADHQRFPREISVALDFKRPEDSLIAPPHIHLSTITLPGLGGNKKNLELVAPLPGYFLWTGNRFGLKLPT